MTPERRRIALCFAHCENWVWLCGMLTASRHADEVDRPGYRLTRINTDNKFGYGQNNGGSVYIDYIGLLECIPNLDDAMTRLGILEVLRRAGRLHAIDDAVLREIVSDPSDDALRACLTVLATHDLSS